MKSILALAAVLGLPLVFPAGGAFGAALCPSLEGETIRFVVPHGVGGGYDTYSRLVARFYGEALQASIRVDNVDEAGGIVGASIIRDAVPDGRTIGILNGPGLMIADLFGQEKIPSPATDYTVLARVARNQHVWTTGRGSGLQAMADVFELAKTRPLVFATRDVASISFFSLVLGAHLLNLPVEPVTGYRGSSEEVLALLRGDVDIMSINFSSGIEELEARDLRPVMQIADTLIADNPVLEGVPLLGGENGVSARWATDSGGDPVQAETDASALVTLIGAGRLIVAPLAMDENLRQCMETTLLEVLRSPGFVSAADKTRLSLDVAPGLEATQDLRRGVAKSEAFSSIIDEAVQKLRDR